MLYCIWENVWGGKEWKLSALMVDFRKLMCTVLEAKGNMPWYRRWCVSIFCLGRAIKVTRRGEILSVVDDKELDEMI